MMTWTKLRTNAAPGEAIVSARPQTLSGRPFYRPDIDGLRAVAVLSVLLFHVGIARFGGGFVGVDVFFVISGYLISQVIRKEIDEGRFSVARFYERRFRRIFPAFIAAISFTTILSYRYLMPGNLHDYARSLLATLFSLSNVYFWQHSSYFDAPSAALPLLQTWSLAIEEQFYIVLPMLLVLFHRRMRHWTGTILAILALASFVASALSVAPHPEATFYMLHTRAWELLLGGLIAYEVMPEITSPVLRNLCSLLGLALIGYAVLFFSAATLFPGPAALVPCLGAALIIAAGRNGPSLVGRLLSLRPVVFIGLISYSLYLWHWPVVVFQTSDALLLDGSPKLGKAVMIAAALVLGALSWLLIERPFRRPGFLKRKQVFLAVGASAAVIMAEAGLLLVLPPRFSPEVAAMAAYAAGPSLHLRDGKCFISNAYAFANFDKADCLKQVPGHQSVIVLGDSHAAHLWYGLSQVYPRTDFMQATAAGCKPTLADARGYGSCGKLVDYILNFYLADHKVDTLLIAARWNEDDLPHLTATLDWAHSRGIHVVLFGPIEQYDSALPRLLALSLAQADMTLPQRHRIDEAGLDDRMAQLAAASSATYVSLQHTLCPENNCVTITGSGVPLQFDYSHLTKDGSVFLARELEQYHLFH